MDYRDPDWVAEKLGIEKNTVYRFLQEGTLPGLQLGRKWLISERRLVEWLEQETDKQTRARREAAGSSERTVRRLDNYTAAARETLRIAHGEARQHGHEHLEQIHLLLSLAIEGKSAAARALRALGVGMEEIQSAMEQALKAGAIGQPVPRRLARTPEAKKAMRLAARLALRDASPGQSPPGPIGTDHLLTGILLARQGLGHAILERHNIARRTLRKALAKEARDGGRPAPEARKDAEQS